MTHPLETDDFVPRAALLDIIKDMEGRLYFVSNLLGDAMDCLSNYADTQATEDGEDIPNHALSTLSDISAQIKAAPFCIKTTR